LIVGDEKNVLLICRYWKLFLKDRKKSEVSGKTVTGFDGRKKVYGVGLKIGQRFWG
jgi:uncharacterized protein affecting Mg2+/Co2+ transport